MMKFKLTSIHLSNNGVGYGASEIINFIREPEVSLLSGSDALPKQTQWAAVKT